MDDVTIERASRGWLLRAECVVPRPLGEVFPLFAEAMNDEFGTDHAAARSLPRSHPRADHDARRP
jgi:hypothetical protein